jgi:hypothetical protein
LSRHDSSGDSLVITRLLNQTFALQQERISNSRFANFWPPPDAPTHADIVPEVNSEDASVETHSSESSGSLSRTSSSSYEHSCIHCNDIAHISRECPNRGRNHPSMPSPQRVHWRETLPSPSELVEERVNRLRSIECRYCHQLGHFARTCPARTPTPLSPSVHGPRERQHRQQMMESFDALRQRYAHCYICHQGGHTSLDCPTRNPNNLDTLPIPLVSSPPTPQRLRGSVAQCHICHQNDHVSWDCPIRHPTNPDGLPTPLVHSPTALVRSGNSRTVL